MPKFLITGATGGLGSHILGTLLESGVKASDIAVGSSRPEVDGTFTKQGIEFRQIDFNKPVDGLKAAFEGVENFFFVSTPTMDVPLRLKQHRNAIEAAKADGVKQIWYCSLAFGGYASDTKIDIQQAHLGTEKMFKEILKGSKTKWTSVREGVYANAFPLFLNWYPTNPNQVLYLPNDAGRGVAYASREELGEATAKLMFRGGYEDEIVLLTGPKAYTHQDLVDTINETTGRNVTIKTVSTEEYIKYNAAHDEGNKPERFYRAWSTEIEGVAKGEAETISSLMAEVLGRTPVDAKEFIKRTLTENPDYTWHQNYAKA